MVVSTVLPCEFQRSVNNFNALVVELVVTGVLKIPAEKRVGSNPSKGTNRLAY